MLTLDTHVCIYCLQQEARASGDDETGSDHQQLVRQVMQ